MKIRLENLLKSIKEETGVEARLIESENSFFEGVETKNGKTQFLIEFENECFLISINGESEQSKQTALLLKKLITEELFSERKLMALDKIKLIATGEAFGEKAKKLIDELNLASLKNFAVIFSGKDTSLENVKIILEKYKKSQFDCFFNYNKELVFIKFISNNEDDKPFTIASSILAEKIMDSHNVEAFVSGVNCGDEIRKSFMQAKLALNCKSKANKSQNIYSFTDFSQLIFLQETPKEKLKELCEILLSDGLLAIFQDDDLMQTCEAFFKNDLNISLSARALYMHRNTLTYRIDKIEKETGLDIKKFSDAETFKLLSIIYYLVK